MVLKFWVKEVLLIVALFSFSFSGMAQTVTGRVLDKKGEAVIGATIVVKRLSVGTVAGIDGRYELKVKEGLQPEDSLIFTSVGYKTVKVTWDSRSTIDVTLEEETYGLDEIVVVGYGTTKKVNLTGSVDQVTSTVFENRPMPNLSRGIQGVIPNLNLKM